MLRDSIVLKNAIKMWVGKRVRYFLQDVLDRQSHGKKLTGPYFGTVMGLTTNYALIEDRLEGTTHRNSVSFTGMLIIQPDRRVAEEYVSYLHATIERPESRDHL
jgi:hypothetical protein